VPGAYVVAAIGDTNVLLTLVRMRSTLDTRMIRRHPSGVLTNSD
jgi:hypothetical protein